MVSRVVAIPALVPVATTLTNPPASMQHAHTAPNAAARPSHPTLNVLPL